MNELEKELNDEFLDTAKSGLSGSLHYLLAMERMFDKDTRKLYEVVHLRIDALLQNPADSAAFDECQLYARAFVRALFAHVEGVTYLMRQVVLWAHDRSEIVLSETERAKLAETRKFNAFPDNFKLGFSYFAEMLGSSYSPDKNDPRYQSFLRAVSIRDAITHPKLPAGFGISGDAIRDAQQGLLWFSSSFRDLLDSLAERQ